MTGSVCPDPDALTLGLAEGVVVLERFLLRRPLGRGAQGAVWLATDLVDESDVAIKVLPGWDALDAAAASREISALRLLAFPGVVRMLDAGTHASQGCVAMELVDGRPFPGSDQPMPWARIEPTVRDLLETLSRVHAAGILHRDIKPANVLVDEFGSPTLLDLGVAVGAALADDSAKALAGTPRYMAPILFHGAGPSAATDLYAVVVMIVEAMTGRFLRDESRGISQLFDPVPAETVLARLDGRIPERIAERLAAIVERGGTSSESAEALLEILDSDDSDRREELVQRIDAVFGESLRARADRLAELLVAEERIVALRSTAARLLFEATEGARDAVTAELLRWVALGIGRIRGGRVELHELDVDRLEQRRGRRTLREERELRATWRRTGLPGLAHATFEGLEALIERGELREALGELPTILATYVELDRMDAVEPILHRWLRVALFANDRRALELLLHEIQTLDAATPTGASVATIALAALAAVEGAFGRARQRLQTVSGSLPFEVALSWHAVNVFRARQSRDATDLAQSFEDARRWAASTGRVVPELVGWEGWCAFHRGDFERSESLHRASAESFQGPRQAQCLLDAGSAALERGAYREADECVAAARRALHGHRHHVANGRAEWLARAIVYRSGVNVEVDEELVRIVERFGAPKVVGTLLVTESAIAWRNGDREQSRELAARAGSSLARAGHRTMALLPLALERAAAGAATSTSSLEGVERLPPHVRIQCAELWLRGGGTLPAASRGAVVEAWRSVDRLDPGLRREVLSLDECASTRSL